MATEKQITANRLNAQLSTGPRTEEGKARVARNALRDGFYSKALVILPGFEQEFQILRDQLLESFKPDGGVQDILFDEIVISTWNLRRAAFSETEIYSKQLVWRNLCADERMSSCQLTLWPTSTSWSASVAAVRFSPRSPATKSSGAGNGMRCVLPRVHGRTKIIPN
ncbi:MAG: hypothetical protein HY820_26685 [Acidobacteria bacterium]|nr:hypothetical protein [Acidobacteriota bacterium]